METIMQSNPPINAPGARLRFVFSDAVMSFDLMANATFEDIALKLWDPALQGYGNPIAIDVAWGARPDQAH
jgi:hypothetical protein